MISEILNRNIGRNKDYVRLTSFFTLLITMLAMTSCDTVLQYPDDEELAPVKPEKDIYLNITADVSYELLGVYEYDFENPENNANILSRSSINEHQLRYVVRVFDASDKSISPTVKASYIYTSPIGAQIDETIKLELLPGDYRIVAWVDYVDINTKDDKYYDTSDFAEIKLISAKGHPGSNDFRDAFYGETYINIAPQEEETKRASILVKRPMAKYTFVSNDLADFLEKEFARINYASDPNRGIQKTSSLSDYTVRIVYNRYMPYSFNTLTGKPADSLIGVEYYSPITMIDDNHAQLAFDYIFTNGTVTSVNVAMEVIYKDGTIVGRMPQFDVPLRRSHQTFVTGKFLTTKSGGAIGINPDFNGEFNIEIQ